MNINLLNYPFQPGNILKNKKSIRKQLLDKKDFLEIKIAILTGSTFGEIKNILELFLLNHGIKPIFYIGAYNRFYEDIVFDNPELLKFRPEIIYIHTTNKNINEHGDTIINFLEIWDKIKINFGCPIIQNNFEMPSYRILGNRDCYDLLGKINEITKLNESFYGYARSHQDFYINDIHYLSAYYGLEKWSDPQFWYMYKYALNVNAIPLLSHNISKIIKSILGKNQKCLVLDLDNTLWGGILGESGVDGIQVSSETPLGEAYLDFQIYIKKLHAIGIYLAICSKNEMTLAKKAFENKNMILKFEDFQKFYANWDNKCDNIKNITKEMNILADSLVFIDDSRWEQEHIIKNIPDVKVPVVTTVNDFIKSIDFEGYFEVTSLSDEDILRNKYYSANMQRKSIESTYKSYEEYLLSLNMVSKISTFTNANLKRISQLISKTNQFNPTIKRYSLSELEKILEDKNHITMFSTLEDKFGHSGIVTAFVGEIIKESLHIRLWVMSCRIFKRNLEYAVFDYLANLCKEKSLDDIIGYYNKTEKNNYVANLFDDLGFCKIPNENQWILKIEDIHELKNKVIKVLVI